MQTSKNTPYYFIVVGLFFLLKIGFTHASNNELTFLLKPTDKIVGFLTGTHSDYIMNSGYYNERLNILIDKSCSGFNFWIISFLVFNYLALRFFDKHLQKVLTIPIALTGAYLLTIFVNSSRIFASIIVEAQTKSIFLNYQHLIHEVVGIITNLTFLIVTYVLLEKFLILKRHHAKLA